MFHLPVKRAPLIFLLASSPPAPHSSNAWLYDSTKGLRNAWRNTTRPKARQASGPSSVLLAKNAVQKKTKATAKASTSLRRRSVAVCPKCATHFSVVGRSGTARLSVRRGSRSSLQVGTCLQVTLGVQVVVAVAAEEAPPLAQQLRRHDEKCSADDGRLVVVHARAGCLRTASTSTATVKAQCSRMTERCCVR